MNTQYRTYILRLRFDDGQPMKSAEAKLFGSVQQVGLSEIHYFDTPEKFQEALRQLLASAALSQARSDDLRKPSRSTALAPTEQRFK